MRPQLTVLTAVLPAVIVLSTRDWGFGAARWWNLVMARLLLVVLAHCLWQDHASPR